MNKLALTFLLLFYCYPAIATSSDSKYDNWRFESNVDTLTDKNNSYIFTHNTSEDKGILLSFNCSFLAVFDPVNPTTNRDYYVKVIYRIDDRKADENFFFKVNNFYATAESKEFFEAIKNGKSIRMRLINSNYTANLSFSLKGVSSAYEKLMNVCKEN